MPVPTLDLTVLRFDLIVAEDIVLPPYKGFAFRGVFGTVLHELACVVPEEHCTNCPFRQTCTYAYLFETSPAEGVDGFRRFSNFPRPYIIHPPSGGKRHFRRYDPLQFECALIGRGSETIPQVIATFDLIGQRGIRNGQGRYLIEKVTVNGDRQQQLTIYKRGRLSSAPVPHHSITLHPVPDQATTVTLSFQTPLLLEERGKIQYEPPRFSLLFEHLARRIMLLQALHGPDGVQPAQIDALLLQAETIQTASTNLQWQSMERISNRQQARIKTGGLVGSITYRGDLTPYIPYLRAGEQLHVGKSTTFGFGRYQLEQFQMNQ